MTSKIRFSALIANVRSSVASISDCPPSMLPSIGSIADLVVAFHSENLRRAAAALSSARPYVKSHLASDASARRDETDEVVWHQLLVHESAQDRARARNALERHPRVVDDERR